MIVHTETPDEYRKRIARRAKHKTAKARKAARKAEASLSAAVKINPARRLRYEPVQPGGDWWNDLTGDKPC